MVALQTHIRPKLALSDTPFSPGIRAVGRIGIVPMEKSALPGSRFKVYVAGPGGLLSTASRRVFACFPLPAARLAGCK